MQKIYLDKKTSLHEVSSLFERLGGQEGVTNIVEGMYAKIFNDPDVADFFRKSDKGHQVKKMAAFFIYTTGGQEDWDGKSMKETHQGRGIGSRQFERVIDHIRSTMHELGHLDELIDELVNRLDLLKPAYLEED
ncbi:hemoglobin [Stylonychia lemnae]|uniref:Group 1 truncated hemoglobin n=1 Tax=Stylonychia lemnae TaxID=5949 RepID=A0A078A2L1_STYLE|nr:hemoglobin [Stylonychia lemnae]|eukprot:CDW76451.1 hemoglobin [Stylonychia lemnae]